MDTCVQISTHFPTVTTKLELGGSVLEPQSSVSSKVQDWFQNKHSLKNA